MSRIRESADKDSYIPSFTSRKRKNVMCKVDRLPLTSQAKGKRGGGDSAVTRTAARRKSSQAEYSGNRALLVTVTDEILVYVASELRTRLAPYHGSSSTWVA